MRVQVQGRRRLLNHSCRVPHADGRCEHGFRTDEGLGFSGSWRDWDACSDFRVKRLPAALCCDHHDRLFTGGKVQVDLLTRPEIQTRHGRHHPVFAPVHASIAEQDEVTRGKLRVAEAARAFPEARIPDGDSAHSSQNRGGPPAIRELVLPFVDFVKAKNN